MRNRKLALALVSVMTAGILLGANVAYADQVTGTGTGQGIDGDVVVEVTADESTIYEVVVTEQELTWFTGNTGTTTLCWRFDCKGKDGRKCVIYADSSNGRQLEIRTEAENVSDM